MRTVPLKRLAVLSVERRRSAPAPVLTLDVVESGTGRVIGDSWNDPREPPEAGVADVEPGDVLFGKLRPYLGKVLRAHATAYASTELLCLRPQHEVNSKWLAYCMLSGPVIDWAVATSEGTKMPRTSWDRLGTFSLLTPAPRQQRAIADFLDAETGRIDALIAKKRQLRLSLEEWEQGAMIDAVGDWRLVRTVSLRQLQTLVVTGPFGTQLAAAEYTSGHVPVVNPVHIQRGRIAPRRM